MRNSGLPTLLSVFSGAGGLDVGLEAAGFEVVGCVERDAAARDTLAANRQEWTILEPRDVEELASSIVPRVLGLRPKQLALLSAGPPCQPFSKAAQYRPSGRAGLTDRRASCVSGLLALIESFLPKAILLENVPGFVQGSTSAADFLRRQLARINRKFSVRYEFESRVVNTADYGVPQNRHRAILVAFRDGREFDWPEASHNDDPIRAGDALRDLRLGQPTRAAGRWAKLLPSIPEGKNYIWHTDRGGGLPLFGYRTKYWSFLLKLARDLPAWTLPANPGPSTGPFHWDNRPLTVEEVLRLQSFPRSWRVFGNRRERLRQAGNATPPLLAEVFGRALVRQLFGTEFPDRLSLSIPRWRALSRRSRPRKVPEEFLELVGNHAEHAGAGLGPAPVLVNGAVRT